MNPFTHPVLVEPLHPSQVFWSTTQSSSYLPSLSPAAVMANAVPHPVVYLQLHRDDFRQSPGLLAQDAKSRSLWLSLAVALCGMVMASSVGAIELNMANALQLQTLKGVGPKTADLIIEERERGGPFEDIQDLGERVKGLGHKKLSGLIEAGLKVSVPAAGAAAPPSTLSAKKPPDRGSK